MPKYQTKSTRWDGKVKAFALGLSGAGLLVSPTSSVNALAQGETTSTAWNRVGSRLETSASKILNESKPKARSA